MEILSIYDNFGNLTDKTVVRGSKLTLNADEHIAVAVIFIENSEGKFLIQKTSVEKGSEFSTTGGHVLAGETPIEAIIRETKEEIGLIIAKDEITSLGYLIYDMPIRFIFYAKKDVDIHQLNIQEEEVEYITYMSKEEIYGIIKRGEITKSHGILFDKVMKLLEK